MSIKVATSLIKKYALYVAFLQALVALLGSLYFSEVMRLPPCSLCWYQRIAMFPLVWILAAGILWDEKKVHLYALPLAAAGLVVSIYHNLIYYGVVPEAIHPCSYGVPCTTRYIEWFGFISLPLTAITAFVVIIVCLLIHRAAQKRADVL